MNGNQNLRPESVGDQDLVLEVEDLVPLTGGGDRQILITRESGDHVHGRDVDPQTKEVGRVALC